MVTEDKFLPIALDDTWFYSSEQIACNSWAPHVRQSSTDFLITLNLLSFLFHTVAELFDRRYLLLRKTLPGEIRGLSVLSIYRFFIHSTYKRLELKIRNSSFCLESAETVSLSPAFQVYGW